MFNITEAEIMANWMTDEPVRVSVCCITYKQEQYIAQAMDSFLMQKTTFPFEIVVGEDCGGDDTLSIIEKYQVRFPNLIKVVTSDKNVGANANLLRVFDIARGDYIAVCEGDDYWNDELKIQRQFDCLESTLDVNICFTAANTLNKDGVFHNYAVYRKNLYSLSEVVRGGGGFMVTATLFFRKKIVEKIPSWFYKAPIGDFYLQVIASITDGALCLNKVMAVYRLSTECSWTEINKNRTTEKLTQNLFFCVGCTRYLTKLGVSELDVKYAVARHESQAAKTFLIRGDDAEFEMSITRSTKEFESINLLQKFMFNFKKNKSFLRCVFNIKTQLDSFFKK